MTKAEKIIEKIKTERSAMHPSAMSSRHTIKANDFIAIIGSIFENFTSVKIEYNFIEGAEKLVHLTIGI